MIVKNGMKNKKTWPFIGIFVTLLASLACQLTSPTPASWSGTPTARALGATNTTVARTLQAALENVTPLPPSPTVTIQKATPQPEVTRVVDGPWLVYLSPDGNGLSAFDIQTETTLTIALPPPIYIDDLYSGLSPQGDQLLIRAGSPLNADELALYQIDFPTLQVTKITPLMSLVLQRRIVNQVGTLAFDTLEIVTRPDGIAWSPDGRFLAFTAALDNDTSDLYVLDTLNDRIDRINGLSSHVATPFWALDSSWLISQELGRDGENWRATAVTGLSVPAFGDQNVLYLPDQDSQEEEFLGWINADTFISFANTQTGLRKIQQVTTEPPEAITIFAGIFTGAAYNPDEQVLAFFVDNQEANLQNLVAGIYIIEPDQSDFTLQRAGNWDHLKWDQSGLFLARGVQGVLAFSAQGQGFSLPNEADLRISPDGQWMVAWGDGLGSQSGARLYQTTSSFPLQTISDQSVEAILWQPDSRSFFIFAGRDLFLVEFPQLNLQPIQIGFPEDGQFDFIYVD